MRDFERCLCVLLMTGLSACAGVGGGDAPIESRTPAGDAAAASAAARRDAAAGTAPDGSPDRASDGVAAVTPLPDAALDPPEKLALAEPAEPVAPAAPARSAPAQTLLAAALQSATRGEWDRAQAALERAVKLAPDDAELWRQLAYARYRRGDHAQALELAQRALVLAPDRAATAASWQLIADIESARGNADAAAVARGKAAGR